MSLLASALQSNRNVNIVCSPAYDSINQVLNDVIENKVVPYFVTTDYANHKDKFGHDIFISPMDAFISLERGEMQSVCSVLIIDMFSRDVWTEAIMSRDYPGITKVVLTPCALESYTRAFGKFDVVTYNKISILVALTSIEAQIKSSGDDVIVICPDEPTCAVMKEKYPNANFLPAGTIVREKVGAIIYNCNASTYEQDIHTCAAKRRSGKLGLSKYTPSRIGIASAYSYFKDGGHNPLDFMPPSTHSLFESLASGINVEAPVVYNEPLMNDVMTIQRVETSTAQNLDLKKHWIFSEDAVLE